MASTVSSEIVPPETGIQLRQAQDQPISEDALKQYGQQLGIDTKGLSSINNVCGKVTTALKECSTKPERFSISENHVCSDGVENSGVDIVAFLPATADVKSVQTEFKSCLEKLGCNNVKVDDKQNVHCDLGNVHVNLGVTASKGKNVTEHRKAVFKTTSKLDTEGKLHKTQIERVSLDLHDAATEAVRPRDEVDRLAQRLARAWTSTAIPSFSRYFTPFDSMMMMRNALDRCRRGDRSLLSAMRIFLSDLSNLQQMSSTFPETSIYDWGIVPDWIQAQRPLLLDPVNPWRNPFQGLNQSVFDEIEREASAALRMLESPEQSSMKGLFNVRPEQEAAKGLENTIV